MCGMANAIVEKPITEAEWEALEDPPGGRYEIIDGRLVVNPSPNFQHNRYEHNLVAIFEYALMQAGLDLPVTSDVEWRILGPNSVTNAPRADVAIGQVIHPEKDIHDAVPLLVAEIWSKDTRPSTKSARRAMWADHGVDHYWDIQLHDTPDQAKITVYNHHQSPLPIAHAAGNRPLTITQPIPLTITPADIPTWTINLAQQGELKDQRIRELEQENERLRHQQGQAAGHHNST